MASLSVERPHSPVLYGPAAAEQGLADEPPGSGAHSAPPGGVWGEGVLEEPWDQGHSLWGWQYHHVIILSLKPHKHHSQC